MASSQSIQFKEIFRDTLYYNKYRYRLTLTLRGIARTRVFTEFDGLLNHLKALELDQQRFSWLSTSIPQGEEIEQLELWFNWRKANPHIKIRLEMNTCSVFSNDPRELLDLRNSLAVPHELHKIVDTSPPDVMTLVKPKFKYRTYLRSRKLSEDEIKELSQFIDRYKHVTRASNALALWSAQDHSRHYWWNGLRSRDTFYIEHDDPGFPLIMSLATTVQIRKTYTLEPR